MYQHYHLMSPDPGPYPGSVETPYDSILGRFSRLGSWCFTMHPLWPDTPKTLLLSCYRTANPVLMYKSGLPVGWTLNVPFQLFPYRKIHPIPSFNNKTWGSIRRLGAPSLRPTTDECVFLFWEWEGPDFRSKEAWFLSFSWFHSNREQKVYN